MQLKLVPEPVQVSQLPVHFDGSAPQTPPVHAAQLPVPHAVPSAALPKATHTDGRLAALHAPNAAQRFAVRSV